MLISKFLSGEADPEEAIFLEDWKAESAANQQYYQQSETLFLLAENEMPQTVDVAAAWEKVAPQLNENQAEEAYAAPNGKIVRFTPAFFRMAASFLILIGIGGSIGYFMLKSPAGDVFASAGKAQRFELKDGTQILVASNSSVSTDAGFGKTNRRLKLKGSAYFTVEHNEAMPFVIDADGVFIQDLGTKFDVKDGKDTLHVRVDEGIVSVYNKNGAQATLHAGENAYYLKSAQALVVHAAETATQATSQPKAIKLDFVNKKLGEVAKSLSKAYGEKVEVQDQALSNLMITTKFENEDLDMALAIITETLGLTYEKTAKGYLIHGK